MSRKPAFPLLTALLLWLALAPDASAANHFVLRSSVSDPPDESPTPVTPRPREKGRKGVRLLFGIVNDFGAPQPGGFPINVGSASVQLMVNGTTQGCTPGPNPTASACGYVAAPYDTAGDVNAVHVYFNGDFPAGATIVATVNGVVSSLASGGMAQEATPSSVTFVTGTVPPRTPATLELVFDVSGSMALPAVPGGTVKRIDALKQASGALFGLLNGHAMLGDKLGGVFFSTTASGGALQPAHDPMQVAAVQRSVMAQVPTDATSIGAGLDRARTAGFTGDSNLRKFVLLFSDGDQNTPPLVGSNPTTCTAVSPLTVGGTDYPGGIKVCPITTGDMTACAYRFQQDIGTVACDGRYLHASETGMFQSFFISTLNSALIGDKLEIARDVDGTLPAGATRTESFLGNTGDAALSILLSWTSTQATVDQPLPFRLTAPDGTVVDTEGATRRDLGMSFTTFHFPLNQGTELVDPRGEWRLELLGHGLVKPLDYHLVVIEDNDRIASEMRIPVTDPGTGEALPIEVRLTDGGAAVSGATVTAELLGPQNGLGDVLSRAAIPDGLPNLSGDLAGSAARAKLALLLADPAFAALLRDQELPDVPLRDDGSGVYRGTFGGATKEGHYQFAVTARGTSATAGSFERTQRLSVFVRPKPDAGRTDLVLLSSAAQTDGSVFVRLRATARDRFGSLLGPDYGSAFSIGSSLGTVVTPLRDNLDGSYEVEYRLPSAAADPTITVEVMGDRAKQERLSDLQGGGASGTWVGSLHAGAALPRGDFGKVHSRSLSLAADLEYRLTPHFSLETYLGHDRFQGKAGGGDTYFTHLSEHARLTFGSGPARASLFAGPGVYDGRSGGSRFGYSLGGSLQYWLRPRFGLEASYVFHDVRTSGDDTRYATVLAGVRFGI